MKTIHKPDYKRIFARAPDLLDALKLAFKELGCNDPNDGYFDSKTCTILKVVIAKAEGK